MKKITLTAFVLGVFMASLAYIAQMNGWDYLTEFMTLGFVGYVLIISATAYYLSAVLYDWCKENEAWQG
jgi:hypothetical protein